MRLERAKRDVYRKAARREGYRSRAAYKLLEVNNSYRILRRGMCVLDLGAAPGGWLQVASKVVGPNGKVIGVDLRPVESLPDVHLIQGDIEDEHIVEEVRGITGRRLDVILADLSPNISGVWALDHAKQIALVRRAASLAGVMLAANGSFVCKVFEGGMLNELRDELKARFARVQIYKPRSSRKESSELYLVCLGYKGF